MADKIEKRSRKAITLHTKMKVIKLGDEGFSNSEIGRRLNLPRTTVVTVIKNRQKILNEVKNATPINTTVIRKRDSLIADMEKLLMVWINDQTSRNISLSQIMIQNKAQSLFNELKYKKGEAGSNAEFGASRGWFDRFKRRCNLNNIKVQGEAAIADAVAAENFPRVLAQKIEDGGYTRDQIFNVDETVLFWKKMPSKVYIDKEEKCMPSKDRLTLLLGTNVSGKFKLKPMLIYHSENPRALKNYAKTNLPVYWKSSANALVTASLFEEWFSTYFAPAVKDYCIQNNIPFKILLLLDTAPSHPRTLADLNPHIQVIFFPPNSTTMLQPMNQGVKADFKFCYLRRTFNKCIATRDSESGNRDEVIKKFLKDFTILDGIETVRDAWNDVNVSTLQDSWRKLCPQLLDDYTGFTNPVSEDVTDIIEMTIKVEPKDVVEIIESHAQALSSELLDHEESWKDKEICEDISSLEPNGLTCEVLSEAFHHFETGMSILEKNDPVLERSSKVNTTILNSLACYREIYKDVLKRSSIQAPLNSLIPSATIRSSCKSPTRKRLALHESI